MAGFSDETEISTVYRGSECFCGSDIFSEGSMGCW
jgi:hypothetical protein